MKTTINKKELIAILETKFNFEILDIVFKKNGIDVIQDVGFYSDDNELNIVKEFKITEND